MYPTGELKELGTSKSALRLRIALRRYETVEQVDRVLRPVRWVDHAIGYWRQIAPFAKLAAGPVGMWFMRSKGGRGRWLARLLRWGPTLWSVVQGMSHAKASGGYAAPSPPGDADEPENRTDPAAAI